MEGQLKNIAGGDGDNTEISLEQFKNALGLKKVNIHLNNWNKLQRNKTLITLTRPHFCACPKLGHVVLSYDMYS